jgi:hypothetical protein
MTNNLEFVLKIYEVSGKKIVKTYIEQVSKRLDLLSIKYEFRIIDENDYNGSEPNMVGGSDSTIPYNYFENFFDKITRRFSGIIPEKDYEILESNDNKYTPRRNIFDRLFSSLTVNDIEKKIDTIDSNRFDNDENNDERILNNNYVVTVPGESIVLPENYTGILLIHITVFSNDDADFNNVGSGLKELENWLKNKE